MRATVLKQTGRNVAAFRRFYSSIDRAALPAPFPCLYRPFPCSPLLSSPFLPFLPPLSRFFFVPSLSLSLYLRSSWSPRSPPRFNAIFLSLSALRATNRRNQTLLLPSFSLPSLFISLPTTTTTTATTTVTHPVFPLSSSFIPGSAPHLFLPSCLTFLGQMPRGQVQRHLYRTCPCPSSAFSPCLRS